LRISTLPTQFGESVVLRVLDRASVNLELETLGFPKDIYDYVIEAIQQPNGIIIVTGPTGCGKTTTLYSCLRKVNLIDSKLLTAEDPVEYDIEGIMQVAINEGVGLTFGKALRSFLRQDPDIIMVGEMRDLETAQIAIQASLTGHLVLTTLHTTDIPSTLARMTDSFPAERQPTIRQEIAAALSAVFVQTLMPRIAGGLVPAAEQLVVQYGARQHIRRNALQHLHQEITITRKNGSFTLEECLARLVKAGVVDRREAQVRANHPEDFDLAVG
jgi:type IV pilus assembly protein PilB